MPRYVAFLRGVSPMNAKMAELKACFEIAGFKDVKTLLSSGNVAFTSSAKPERTLARQAEAAMSAKLGRSFETVVRSAKHLKSLLDSDPYAAFPPSPQAKRVVSFLYGPLDSKLDLPLEFEGARILALIGQEAFSDYLPHPKGPVFMSLIEKTFGKNVTTRTWETVRKCAAA